jgi:uncharacterized membrane protein YecN with MAPEG domain
VVIFLPALWLAGHYVGVPLATVLGAVWLAGRVWYAVAYLREPKTRGGGFVLAYVAWGLLVLAAAWSALKSLAGF